MIRAFKALAKRCLLSTHSKVRFNKIENSKRRYKIAIWGCNEFSKLLSEFVIEDDIEIVCYIDPESALTSFCERDVLDVASFNANVAFTDVPIVIASPHVIDKHRELLLDFESLYQFKLTLQTVQHQVKNPILHPAALVDLLNISFGTKALLFGFQGAGNTVFNHLFLEIFKYKKVKYTSKQNFFSKLCLEYRHEINQSLTTLLYTQNARNHHLVPWKIGTTHINCSLGDEEVSIFSIHTRDHITNQSFVYHQIPSKEYLLQLMAQDFKPFLIIRNPLDMIVSVLNKTQAINKVTSHISEVQFVYTSRWVIGQLKFWHAYTTILPILKYDQLLSNPNETIIKMMLSVGIEPSADIADKIWTAVGFKQLPNAPDRHFWQGGAGKWEKYFDESHLSYLKHAGIEKILDAYEYRPVLERFRFLTKRISTNLWKKTLNAADTQVNFTLDKCSGDETRSTKEYMKALYDEQQDVDSSVLHVISANQTKRQRISDVLKSEYVQQLVLSGSHPDMRLN